MLNNTPRRPLLAAVLGAVFLSGLPFALPAQEKPADSPALLEEQRVTAVDTLLHFERGAFSEWATGNATPENLGPADFEVSLGGVPRQVVAVESFERLDPARRSPWTQLIYIDCNMLSTGDLRRALSLLHRELGRVLALGPIEVLIADPAPRRLISPTTSNADLEALLSRLALDTDCHDAPQELRDELLRALQNKNPKPAGDVAAPTPAELVTAAYEAEEQAVGHSTLGLVQALTQEPRSIGAQKVVYLLHNGFDRRAGEFYGRQGAPANTEQVDAPAIGPILLAKLIASYGWTVMPVSEQAFRASLKGAEVGRFLVQLQSGREMVEKNPELSVRPTDQVDTGSPWQTFLGGVTASLREKRDPKRAESYLELAQALAGQKKWPEAEDAYRKAIYHFDGAKKHQASEAKAWLGVGMVKAEQGDLVSGRAATERAIELDAKLADNGATESVGLSDRGLFLAGLAEATLGSAVVGEEQLRRALGDLNTRLRLTYQVTGDATGELMPLVIKHRGGKTIKALPWGRFGTPEEVAEARLLASLDDDLGAIEPEGGLDLSAFAATKGKMLDLDLLAGEERASIRVSILRGSEEGAKQIEHRRYELASRPKRDLAACQISFGATGSPAFLAILIENLETGEWGIRTFDNE